MTFLLLLACLAFLPATVALLSHATPAERATSGAGFRIGTPVVYQQEQVTTHPASDLRDVRPSERGEYYYYSIFNYLRVIEVLGDGRIIAVARDRQRLCFWPDDSALRKARLTERLLHPMRFPA